MESHKVPWFQTTNQHATNEVSAWLLSLVHHLPGHSQVENTGLTSQENAGHWGFLRHD